MVERVDNLDCLKLPKVILEIYQPIKSIENSPHLNISNFQGNQGWQE